MRAAGILSVKEAVKIDIAAKEKFGISTLVLMENAGRAVSDEILKVLGVKQRRIAIFCGKGKDGFAAARHLLVRGFKPDIYEEVPKPNWFRPYSYKYARAFFCQIRALFCRLGTSFYCKIRDNAVY